MITIGGHRGFGCTDHAFYQYRPLAELPVENTLASIRQAFDAGAHFVELDAVFTADNQVAVLHNVVPTDHFFTAPIPAKPINQLPWDDIRNYPTGRHGTGSVALLADVLTLITDVAPPPYRLTRSILN